MPIEVMYTRTGGSDEEKLEALFRAYRDACPAPEAGPNFMPQLWQRIEARQKYTFFLRRAASGFVTAAVAATLAMAVYIYLPHRTPAFYSESYVEALMASQSDTTDYFDTLHYDPSDPAGKL